MVGRCKMKWKHTWITGGVSRLIGWHWQRPRDAWFPLSWSCALSMDLDFGVVCDSISYMVCILQILSAKKLKHRQINWQMLGEGMCFEFGFFSPSISKVCHIRVFEFRRGSSLSDEFWMPPRRKHRVGVFGELLTGLFRNHSGVRLILWYEILRHF